MVDYISYSKFYVSLKLLIKNILSLQSSVWLSGSATECIFLKLTAVIHAAIKVSMHPCDNQFQLLYATENWPGSRPIWLIIEFIYNMKDLLMTAFLDILLMEIRGITISHSSYKKREKEKKERSLILEINEIENSKEANHSVYSSGKFKK